MIPDLPPDPPAIVEQAQQLSPFAKFGGVAGPITIDPFKRFGGHATVQAAETRVIFHEKMAVLFQPKRYKVFVGGRGGVKSWSIARALILKALMKPTRILCAREFQTTITDSVHKLLMDQINLMGLDPWFKITKKSIRSTNGSEFIFVGLGDLGKKIGRTRLKSYEAIDICWVEEAEGISADAWEILTPTIRKPGSEIWVSFNPSLEDDATYQRFIVSPPPNSAIVHIGWHENPWLSKELLEEKDWLYQVDSEAAAHVWDGQLKRYANALVYRGKVLIHEFEPPENVSFYHGVDWGFSQDPLVALRMWTTGTFPEEELWIDYEAFDTGIEIDQTAQFFERIPTMRNWPILADNARPEMISAMRRLGFNISAADKWSGSIEDGIAHIRGFKMVHIHKTRAPKTAVEFNVGYKFKVDPVTSQITPIPVDKHNNGPDATRYALDKFIKRRGNNNIWAALGR